MALCFGPCKGCQRPTKVTASKERAKHGSVLFSWCSLYSWRPFSCISEPALVKLVLMSYTWKCSKAKCMHSYPKDPIHSIWFCFLSTSHGRIQMGGQGVGTPPEKSQNYRPFSSNTGPDPLKSQLPSQHSMFGHHWHASETPFYGVLLAGRWWPAFSGTCILPPHQLKK